MIKVAVGLLLICIVIGYFFLSDDFQVLIPREITALGDELVIGGIIGIVLLIILRILRII